MATHNPYSRGGIALLALLPVYFVLNSFFFGTVFYLAYWLEEKDF